MANPMMTGNFSELVLTEGLQEIYFNTLKDYPLVMDKIANVMSTKKLVETDLGMAGFPYWGEKEENKDITYTDVLKGRKRTYTQVVRSSGYKVTWKMLKFELYNVINQLPRELAFAGVATIDYVFSLMFLRAATAGYEGSDGVNWASAAHPYVRGGVGSNYDSNLTLSRANVQTILGNASLWTNESGIPKNATAKLLQVHPSQVLLAQEIISSPDRPDKTDRAKNVLFNKLEIVPNPNLGVDDWNIIFNDQAVRKIKAFWSQKPGTLRKSHSEKNRDLYMDDILAIAIGFSGWQDVYFGYIG